MHVTCILSWVNDLDQIEKEVSVDLLVLVPVDAMDLALIVLHGQHVAVMK